MLGEVGSIHYFFQQFSILHSLVESEASFLYAQDALVSRGQEILLKPMEFEEPEESPVTIKTTLEFSGHAFISLGKMDWSFFSHTFDIRCDFGFKLEAKFTMKLVVQIPNEKLPFYDKEFPKDPTKWVHFPVYAIATSKFIAKVVNIFLPESHAVDLDLGLYVVSPTNIMLEAEQEMKMELGGVEATATTGEKELQFRASSNMYPDLEFTVNERATISSATTLITDKGLDNLSVDANMKLSGLAGIKPQLEFKTFGLARGAVGIRSGFFFEAKYTQTTPLPPIEVFSWVASVIGYM